MAMKTLADAFSDELRDMYSAEKQLTAALKKMAQKATNEELQKGFEQHLEQTNGHIERLEQVFKKIDKEARAKKCEAMEGIVKEGESVMGEDAAPEVMDALLIACAQKVEHYEIATYGTLCTWAEQLGYSEAKKLLGDNLEEEEETDKKLTKLAKSVNKTADMS